MQIETFPLGPLDVNCYLAWENGQAVAVDPGGDPAPVVAFLKSRDLTLDRILLTHFHFDHLYGVQALAEATGARAVASPEGEPLRRAGYGWNWFPGFKPVSDFDFDPLAPGPAAFAGQTCHVLATPGHAAGSLCYYFPQAKACFVGDVIFYRGVGRTDFPGGSFETLRTSITEQLFTLPDETVLYPGHGEPTTVGEERLHNPYLKTW